MKKKDIQKQIEKILMHYMDGTYNGFEYGYIPDLFDVESLRNDLVNWVDRLVNPRCNCSRCTGLPDIESYYKDNEDN